MTNSKTSRIIQSQKRQENKLRKTIESLRSIAENSAILADMPTKGLGIVLGDKIPEELKIIINHQPENKVEMECFGKTLERLWFYLNFYRQSNDLVEKLRKTAKSLMKNETNKVVKHQVRVTAFRIADDNDSNKILNNLASKPEIFYTTDSLEIFDLERLLFIESSRYLIEYGDISLFKTTSGLRFLNKFLTLKKWILANFTKQEFEKFLLMGSTILFSFGIRVPTRNDIDLYIYNDGQDKSFVRRFKKNLKNAPENFLDSIDILLKDFGRWGNNHHGKSRELYYYNIALPKIFNAENIKQVIDNQEFHYFFLGLKCISFQATIERKARQTRPKSYADLLYMEIQKRLWKNKNWTFRISRLRDLRWNRQKRVWEIFFQNEHDKFYEKIQQYLKKIYNYDLSIEEIRKKISNSPYIEVSDYLTRLAK